MPHLRVVRGPDPGRLIELVDDVITIGRGRKNTIIIHDNEISREHCRLVKVLFDYEIADLNSTNGTFLNGRPVGEVSAPLADKSIIELGDSIVLEYIAAATSPAPDVTSDKARAVANAILNRLEPRNFYLVVRRHSQLMPEVYLLDSPLVDVGRHLDNAICLAEAQVSRFHMRLNRLHNGYMLEDLGSMNGTMVNGARVEKTLVLKPGDYITIGNTVEMWFTDDLETLRMVPYKPQALATGKHEVGAEPPSTSVPMPGTTLLDPNRPARLSEVLEGEELQESTESIPPQDPARDAAKLTSQPQPPAGLLAAAASLLPPAPAKNPTYSGDIAEATKSTEESPDVSAQTGAASTEEQAKE